VAAVPAYGDNAALSHASGAALWTVRPSASAWIDVSVASHGGRAKRSGIRLHRCAALSADELTTHRGIPVTTLERTLLDIAGMVARPALERAVERAEILRLLDTARLRAVIDAHPRHRGAVPLRAALELYRDDEMTRSDLEAFFVERDRAKDARLTLAGYRVVRLTHRQVEHQRNATVATVVALLRASAQGAPRALPPNRLGRSGAPLRLGERLDDKRHPVARGASPALAPVVEDRLRRLLLVHERDHDGAVAQRGIGLDHAALQRVAQIRRELALQAAALATVRRPCARLDDRQQRAAVDVLGDDVDLVGAVDSRHHRQRTAAVRHMRYARIRSAGVGPPSPS
jgi:hypothetical protein